MSYRTSLLNAGRRAAQILDDLNIRKRIDSGYTRVDPVKIAYENHVVVFFRPLEKLLGAFLDDDQPGILVNVDRPRGLVHMTCAHELGHFFLGHKTTADTELDYGTKANLIELQADQFAYSLMAPKWLIVKLARIKGWSPLSFHNPEIVYQLSLRLGISFTAAVWTLHSHKFLNESLANKMANISLQLVKQRILGSVDAENRKRDVWLLDKADQEFILEPSPDDGVVVALPNHAAAGYLWSIDEATAAGFHIEPQLLSENDATENNDDLIVGSIGYTQYRLFTEDAGLSEKGGQQRVSLSETQPWLERSAAIDHYQIKAEFESMGKGLSSLEKSWRVQGASN